MTKKTMNRKSVLDRYKDYRGEEGFSLSDKKPNTNVLIIDGMNTFIRSWSVNPTMNEHGDHYGGTVGFLKSLSYSVRLLEATRCIVVFDGKGGSQRRKKIYPEYKDKRNMKFRVNRFSEDTMTKEEERALMKMQLLKVVEYLEDIPVTIMIYDNVEADDVIAYLATKVFSNEGEGSTILSTDKDFIQLVNDQVTVYNPVKKISYTKERVFSDFGIAPENFLYYRILDGDKSDNIPGIPGAGMKTVLKRFPMLSENRSVELEDMLSYAEMNKEKYKIYSMVLEHKDEVYRNHMLMRLDEVNIAGTTKLKIMSRVSEDVPRLNKKSFIMKMTRDGLGDVWSDPYNWLYDGFTTLDIFAKKINEEKREE